MLLAIYKLETRMCGAKDEKYLGIENHSSPTQDTVSHAVEWDLADIKSKY
jgi:hypothetical protein